MRKFTARTVNVAKLGSERVQRAGGRGGAADGDARAAPCATSKGAQLQAYDELVDLMNMAHAVRAALSPQRASPVSHGSSGGSSGDGVLRGTARSSGRVASVAAWAACAGVECKEERRAAHPSEHGFGDGCVLAAGGHAGVECGDARAWAGGAGATRGAAQRPQRRWRRRRDGGGVRPAARLQRAHSCLRCARSCLLLLLLLLRR
jgi:hypothetical protein